LQVERTVVESVDFDPVADAVVVSVRPFAAAAGRCAVCGRRCPREDRGRGRRRWRMLDVGPTRCYLAAEAPRVRCVEHGVLVAAVPWARPGAGHTYGFDQQVAWLVRQTSRSAVCRLMRLSWRTVGRIVARVVADADAQAGDRLDGLRRIGIDEISYRRGHKYLLVTWNMLLCGICPVTDFGLTVRWFRPLSRRGGDRGAVAGLGPACAGGGVAAGLG